MTQIRANPDDLLMRLQDDAPPVKRGRLKIFFGYAAGVGKTYAMLKAAHSAKQHGIDVVAGYIEPHTRPQTMQLLHGLERLPSLLVDHKGIQLKEFDLDAAIARHPQLILIDELAHTNAPGCRHRKRYQDVEELLKAGIDVYSTINVQHIESLNDIVASITGITVRERIPDRVFDQAEQVELVDIEPEDLIARLHEGKIYKRVQAEKALTNFFRQDNLIALREIALRRTADRVNKIAEKQKSSDSFYFTDEHILVCLSSAPSNAKLIRTASRMANAFKGVFTALYVETSYDSNMAAEDKARLQENIKLAEQLGAKIETVYGEDVAFQIAEYARLSGISKIVIGRTNARRRFPFPKQSFSERLTAYAPTLDVYIIPDKPAGAAPYSRRKRSYRAMMQFSARDFVKTLILITGSTLLGLLFARLGFTEANIITVYLLGVLLIAVTTSHRFYSLIASVVNVFLFNFFFTEPRFTFNAYDSQYPVTFAVMFFSALLVGSLATKIKLQAKQTSQTAYRTKILLETNQVLQQGRNQDEIATSTAKQLLKLLNRTIIFYTTENHTLSKPIPFPAEGDDIEHQMLYLTENERAAAQWVYKNNTHAGASTNTLSGAKCLYLAVRGTGDEVYGVVAIALNSDRLDPFENNLVLSILGECALALERDLSNRRRAEAAMRAQNEQLRANLLRAISHDLRTPLTSISGNAAVLMQSGSQLLPEKRDKLYLDIYDDSMWLINLVENLLSVTRIEDGTMNIHMNTELIDEIISEALRHVNRNRDKHIIRVEEADDLLLVRADSRLIIQVIINIVDNAIKYTQEGSEIVISTARQDTMAAVSISDNGPGIPAEARAKIFDMFYTVTNNPADSRRGLGLGLALCKSIVNAHGGTITVRNNMPHGTVFSFTLPAEEVKLHG